MQQQQQLESISSVQEKKLDNSTKMLINGWKKLVNQPINFTSILVVQSQYNFICACHVSEASKIQKEIVANFHTNSEHHILVRSQIGTKKFSQKDKISIHLWLRQLQLTYGWPSYLGGKGTVQTIFTGPPCNKRPKVLRPILMETRPNQWFLQGRTILQHV